MRGVQDLFGEQWAPCVDAQDLGKVGELMLDGCPAGPKLGDLTRALLASRRERRMIYPLCFTVVQHTPAEGYFACHFVEDRVPPNAPSYHEYLVGLHKRISMR
jgi:hypothetical protein